MEEKLKIAIQRSGRLTESSLLLLKQCDIRFNSGLGKVRMEAENFPLEIYFLRDDDIPEYVADMVADIGIVGENVVLENKKAVEIVQKLGFGSCRLSLAVPRLFKYESIKDLQGKRIATSYPNILGEFLKSQNVTAEIHRIGGSVEVAPSIGLADAVCDLVSSGSTLFSNGLQEVQTVLQSEAVLIARHNLSDLNKVLLEKLIFRFKAVYAAKSNKYIMLNAPNDKLKEIVSLLPGLKSPTIIPLALDGWSAIHSVINENDFWETIESLKKAGAEGILVMSIEQMVHFSNIESS